jgi:spore coat protein A
MKSTDRRRFLKLCAQSVSALALSKGVQARGGQISSGAPAPSRTPQTIDRFIDPLPIPKRVSPVEAQKGKLLYHIRMEEFRQRMHSQLPATRLWGYEGQYPGPIFEATRGVGIEVEWENKLPTQHIFAIDPHIHGAMPPSPAVRTVPHLHGARTESASDGLPENWFVPGASARYFYPNSQQAATLWYHDHALGITRLNMYAGLSGF